jgi:hypothetical protein
MAVTQIQFRRDSATNWSTNNPILSSGEIGYVIETRQFKIGDGGTRWNVLDYRITTPDITQTLSNKSISGSSNTLTNIPNSALTNPSFTINGVNVALGATGAVGSWTGQNVSSNITLQKNYNYFIDTSAARTLTLPASPTAGDEIHIFDATGTGSLYSPTILRNGSKIMGLSDDLSMNSNNFASTLIYISSGYGWKVA